MSALEQTPAALVARFLKANHYEKTLEAFLREANLAEDIATTNPGDWTLEKVLQEKILFDASVAFERKEQSTNQGWTQPAPSVPHEPDSPMSANVLSVTGLTDTDNVLVTSAQNDAKLFSASELSMVSGSAFSADSPILSNKIVLSRFAMATTMSGKLTCYDPKTGSILGEGRYHTKWAVQLAVHVESEEFGVLVATAGWDQKINLHLVSMRGLANTSSAAGDLIRPPIETITVPSNPESVLFVRHPDTNELYLVVSRRDSTFLYYHRLTLGSTPSPSVTIQTAGRQNLAPHANAWVAFSPSNMSICPIDSTLLAVATSHQPHMKVIIVRLLFPGASTQQAQAQTAAAAARADLALQDKEDAAISLQVSTMAPQTPYSTPQIVWRPDGSGLWVNGDDGVIRGVETKTGKVIALLKGHEVGSKVRTLWAGRLRNGRDDSMEVLVSGGFDKRMIFWRLPQ